MNNTSYFMWILKKKYIYIYIYTHILLYYYLKGFLFSRLLLLDAQNILILLTYI